MAKLAKKKAEARSKVDRDTFYSPQDAVNLLKAAAYANFDESIEAHARLGIDPRQADQAVRSTVTLPHGTGQSVKVLVFAEGEADRIATEAGADFVGSDDLIKQIQDGWVEFDAAIATADMMGKVGGLGRVLGRRGLMPNPRSGTVVRNIEDLPGIISDLKGGRVEFRNDRLGIVHSVIGKKHFTKIRFTRIFWHLSTPSTGSSRRASRASTCEAWRSPARWAPEFASMSQKRSPAHRRR